jgi:hypothetical protein
MEHETVSVEDNYYDSIKVELSQSLHFLIRREKEKGVDLRSGGGVDYAFTTTETVRDETCQRPIQEVITPERVSEIDTIVEKALTMLPELMKWEWGGER